MDCCIEAPSPPNPLPQKRIDLRKGFGSEKAPVGAEWRGVSAFDDEVTAGADELLFALGMLAP